MITQEQFKEHFLNLYNTKAIYVWGANCDIITKELTDNLYKNYGSLTYTKSYYDNKFIEGKNKIGADCSGAIFPLSKKDNTAKGYYNACNKKGIISNLPKNTACLVFNSNFTHVGAYMGDETTIEMMNSKNNCVKQNFNKTRWTYYGIPSWLDTSNTENDLINNNKHKIIKSIQEWCNNYCNAKLNADGIFGPEIKKGLCKALQHYLNISKNTKLKEDGIFGTETKKVCIVAVGKTPLVYICQAMLYCKGYDMSESIRNNNLDGTMGQNTKNQILLYQQNTRGLKHDGYCGPSTFYAMFNS